ncbi:MAG: HAMP domain-containing histidine kinase [Acidobacteria bacterium]|nr:HAMP domain-containing histidine kinase [Acidobacteriota bacterium]
MAHKPSLQFRLAASHLLVFLAISLIVTLFFGFFYSTFIHRSLQRVLDRYAESLTDPILASDRAAITQIARQNNVEFVVFPRDGAAFAVDREGDFYPAGELPKPAFSFLVSEIARPSGAVRFHWRYSAMHESHYPMIIGFVILLIAVFGGAFYFQNHLLSPLRRLRAGVEAVALGDLNARVEASGQDEIGQVAQAFNQMTEQIQTMISDRERLLADVSHELRSPLARIQVALALLEDETLAKSMREDVLEMEHLTQMLLDRERFSADVLRAQTAAFDWCELVTNVSKRFADQAPGLKLLVPERPVSGVGSERWLSLVLQNLLDNAFKFSRADSLPVEVELGQTDQTLFVEVRDDGIGIDPQDCDRIFEPFVKLRADRGHHQGFGLGLNLCQRIVTVHGGTLRCYPQNQGCLFRLELPDSNECAQGRALPSDVQVANQNSGEIG